MNKNLIIESSIILRNGAMTKLGKYDFKLDLTGKNAYFLIGPAIKLLKC